VDIMDGKAYLNRKKMIFSSKENFLPGLKPGNGDNGEGAFPYGLGAEEEICPSAEVLS